MFTACGIKHRRCFIPQSSAPEDGRNYRPKHVELIEIINKFIIAASSWLFLLLYQLCTVRQTSNVLYAGVCLITTTHERSQAQKSLHSVNNSDYFRRRKLAAMLN